LDSVVTPKPGAAAAIVVNLEPETAPLVDRIVAALRRQVNDVFPPGSRVPSIREFARTHRVSRFTVVEAYDRLVAMGYLEARRGSGFYTTHRSGDKRWSGLDPERERGFDVAWMIRDVLEDRADTVKAGAPWLPDEWLDQAGIRAIVRQLARNNGDHLLSYGHPAGYLPLRQQLQLKLSELGIAAAPEQIVLTYGTSQALDLLIRRLVRPGDAVLVDDPGYYNMFGYLRMHGARLLGVPRNHDGPDVVALRRLAAEHHARVYFTQTVMQNPTGTDTSPAVMYRVLQAGEELDLTIVEDDTYCDLQASPSPRLATLDQLNRVVYVRSFSKTLSGSLRVGFIAAGRGLADDLINLKVLSCITTSQFIERLLYLILTEGHYRKYIEHLRGRVDQARGSMLRMMKTLGMQVFAEPVGGNFLWARFPHVEDAATLSQAALEDGVMLAPGAVFRPNLEPSPYMRFNVSLYADTRLRRVLGKIARSAS
jgi:DNA-binding transcriptional MocR family regulator